MSTENSDGRAPPKSGSLRGEAPQKTSLAGVCGDTQRVPGRRTPQRAERLWGRPAPRPQPHGRWRSPGMMAQGLPALFEDAIITPIEKTYDAAVPFSTVSF